MMPMPILTRMENNISSSVGRQDGVRITVYVEGNDECTGLTVILSGDVV